MLFTGIGMMLVSTDCGGPARSGQRSEPWLPEHLSGGQQGIALSMDPTEVGLIRLQDVVDSLKITHEEYRIGVEDKLEISVFARNFTEDTEAEELVVRDDGRIYLSLLGEIQATGLTVSELRQRIAEESAPFVKDPFVLVTVKEYNSQRVTIIGEIGGGSGSGGGRAVTVPLQGPTRLVNLLAATILTTGERTGNVSASPRVDADISNIIVTRKNGERYRVNLNTYLFGFDSSSNIEIIDGDLIFIPHQDGNRIFVLGEVNSPGVVSIGLGLTATEAIARSGGFTNIARRNDVRLVRGGLQDPNVITVSVWDVAKKGRRSQDVPLRNGDILFIPRSPLGSVNILLSQILPPLQTYLFLQALVN